MRQYAQYFMLAGGILTFLCFFMPWVKFELPSDLDKSLVPEVIGIQEATRGLNFTTLSLVALLTILGISIYYILTQKIPWKFKTIVQISCIIGVLCIMLTLIQFTALYRLYSSVAIGTYMAKDPQFELNLYKIYKIQLGGYGAAAGFILAYIGVCNIPNSIPSMKNNQ